MFTVIMKMKRSNQTHSFSLRNNWKFYSRWIGMISWNSLRPSKEARRKMWASSPLSLETLTKSKTERLWMLRLQIWKITFMLPKLRNIWQWNLPNPCGGRSTRLGGPFGVGWILLQQFEAFDNEFHPLSNGDGQVTNCVYSVGCAWITLEWCKWGSVNGHITWWRKATHVGVGQDEPWKGAQMVQRFCGQVPMKGEFWSVVEHQKFPIVIKFEPQIFGPICESIQSVGKKNSRNL